jgi:hypothetical protein
METVMDTRHIQLPGVRSLAWLISVSLFAGCGIFGGGGGSEATPMHASSTAPAATGSVKAKREKGNYNLSVAVEHMAPAEKLVNGATTYVVWAQPTNGSGTPQNLGSLKVGENRSGKLNTVTSARDMKITVTAEPEASVSKPTGEPLLWTRINE